VSNEKPVISKSFSDEQGRTLKVDYFLTSGACMTDGAEAVPVYGVRADLYINGQYAESAKVDDISPSREETTEMAKRFADNQVTPVSLKDVVEDCIAAQLKQ
jgi:hypothetical protein